VTTEQTTTNEQTAPAPGADLDALIDSCIATAESRYEDWDALGFQAAQGGDRFKRAQIRYIGSGATGDHSADSRTLKPGGFTFSNMKLPVGAVGPEHTHHDVEEVFYVLEGKLEVAVHDVEDGTKVAKRVLGYRDLIRVPAGVPRSLKNVGDTDALFCVVIGAPKPQLPTYPPSSEMYGVKR
jgi:quercetin dioxygenase-like cupin family protein